MKTPPKATPILEGVAPAALPYIVLNFNDLYGYYRRKKTENLNKTHKVMQSCHS